MEVSSLAQPLPLDTSPVLEPCYQSLLSKQTGCDQRWQLLKLVLGFHQPILALPLPQHLKDSLLPRGVLINKYPTIGL